MWASSQQLEAEARDEARIKAQGGKKSISKLALAKRAERAQAAARAHRAVRQGKS
jgi:hypothetical protein